MRPTVALLDPGFVRLGGRWLPTNRASDHRAAGHTVDTRVKPLRTELQPLYNAAKRRAEYPCAEADNHFIDQKPSRARSGTLRR